ncbi:VanW family protein [Demequina aurantiaca]|uniref:VanW family protein n=1 Tax=Demequina aurantiaca TaxID=676200 RepID=UPI003D349059
MSRQRDAERALAKKQEEAKRKSSAHRSLRKRADKRAATADAGAAQAEEVPQIPIDGAPEVGDESPAQTASDADAGTDAGADADQDESALPDADAEGAEGEASTDTVVFARVPEFLRETNEPEADDSETAEPAPVAIADDSSTEEELDSDSRTALAAAALAGTRDVDDAPSDQGIGVDGATPPESPEDAPEAALEDSPADSEFAEAEFAEAEIVDAHAPGATAVDHSSSAQEATMVMDTVPDLDPQQYTPNGETYLEATIVEDLDGTGKRTKRRRWPWVALLLVIILGGAYYAFAAYSSGHVSSNTEALGVDIGGMGVEEATDALDDAALATVAAPITLTTENGTTTLVPSEAGLSIDTAAMVDSAVGFTLNPSELFAHLFGTSELAPVVVVDDVAMDTAINSASVQLDTADANAAVSIEGTTATTVAGVPSVTVDHDDTADRIVAQWPAQSQIEAAVVVADATVPDHEADRTVQTLNQTVLTSAVTLTGPNGDVVLEPAEFAQYLSVMPDGSRLEIVADGPALAATMIEADPELETDPVDATVSFDTNHKLVTSEGEPGAALDGVNMGQALVDAAMAADRSGPMAYRAVQPEITSEGLGLADLKEVVSSFSTPLTPEPVRTKNLVRGAEKVSGVVILPNDEFDLTDALTPITLEDGFFPAHVIVDGILQDGIGGGLSQMATTTYNAGYFAGYKDITHRPHSKYFTRYPAGRESTIYTGQINMVFENDTPYAAVMSSYVKNNSLYVDIWSTPYYTVTTYASPRSNVVQPTTVELDRADCQPSGGGSAGFTISNTRTVFLKGEQVDKTTDTWTYLPDNKIECK